MIRLNARQLHALNQVLLRIYEQEDGAAPLEMIVDAMEGLMPSTWFSADEVFRAPDRMVHRVGRNLQVVPDLPEKLQRYGHEHPIVAYLQNGNFAPALRISDFVTLRELKRTTYYHEVLAHMTGFRDQTAILCHLPSSVMGFTLNRDRAFSEEERLMAELLQPHFERVLSRAVQFAPLSTEKPLTAREREVLHWVAEGKRDEEVAAILKISPRTAEQHVRAILRKLGVETRGAAIAAAWRARRRESL